MATAILILAAGLAVTPAMELAKPGAVKPRGGLLAAAQAQRDGYTGHLDEIDDQFRRAWAPETHPRGKDLSWNTKPGAWSCEGGAYWFDGLVKLAFQLDDPDLKAMASNRLETVLSRMPERPIGFCWWLDRDDPQCVKEMNGDPWLLWVAGMFERPVAAWYEATGDRRVPEVLARVFDGHAFAYRGRATTPSGAVDAYRLTHDRRIAAANDAYFKELAAHPETLRPVERQYQTPPVRYLEETLNLRRRHQYALGLPSRHGVIASETLLSVFRAYQWTGRTEWLKAVRAWYAFFDTHMRQPYGFTVMDEEWGYPGPGRGTETCVVAAEAWTRINLLAGLGEGAWGDDVECGFFNAGPNCVTPDFRKHVYMQQPNRIAANDLSQCSFGGDPGEFLGRYDAKHWPLCCTAALNRILPNYVQAMWMVASDGGVAAALYGPCSFETELKGGRFAAVEETDYPFADTIRIRITAAPTDETTVRFRMPKWCANPSLELNGTAVAPSVTNGFAVLSCTWTAGDEVTLRFPMRTELHVMRDLNLGQFGRRYGYFTRGPLLLAKKVPGTDENTPVEPVEVPEITEETDPATLGLVPYGQAKLRVSMFPIKEK